MAICRTPVFSPDDAPEKCFPALKKMIRESSPEFYQIIENLDHPQLNTAGEKIAFSVWKYFNRAKYRATPFGSFAAISYIPVATLQQPLVLATSLIKHTFTDWSEKDSYKDKKAPEWFQTNTTCYTVGGEIRYIKFTGTQFELATVPIIPELTTLLQLCRDKTQRDKIYKVMDKEFGMAPRITDDLIVQMLDNQLLFSEQSPNITGPDYFERLNVHDEKKSYIISGREYLEGSLDPSPLNMMPEYFSFIKDFQPQGTNENLNNFQRSFSKKFDLKVVPLSLALDPETGVGYGGLETESHEQELAGIFGNKQTDNNASVFSYTAQYRFLLNSLIKGDIIHLENFKENPGKNSSVLPNTFNTIFSFWNGMPVIENAGGCTANALLGRFTLTGGQSYEMAKNIADIEEQVNPGVLFFDVAYQAEKQVDNVNRRAQLYENELPLLTWSCLDEPLSLDDLLVMVRGGEIILWSKKYQKRAVPRIASAYNYTRSDLAAFRFLCDLQHQQLTSDLTFRFRQIMPGLDHYPRVLYKNIIISPEMWKLNSQNLDMDTLKRWLNERQIHSHFKCGNADQTLCFDPANDEDLNAFLIYLRQKKDQEIYITEALLGDTITDPAGKKYIPQYIATFFHREQVYKRYTPTASYTITDIFQPGSEWLYTEVYCHPLRSNQILQVLRKFTVKHNKLLKKWFFIRYTDPSPHIRLRLHLIDALSAGLLMSELRTELTDLSAAGLISDIQVKTYSRESERYGPGRMSLVEEHFYNDSKYIAGLLSHRRSNEELHILTLRLMYHWLVLAGIKDTVSFVKTIADNFSEEFNADKETYKQINRSFELIKKNLEPAHIKLSKSYETGFLKVIKDCKEDLERQSMLADLIHMHVNRVFYTGQRMHEAILYQYLLKWLKAKQFRRKA